MLIALRFDSDLPLGIICIRLLPKFVNLLILPSAYGLCAAFNRKTDDLKLFERLKSADGNLDEIQYEEKVLRLVHIVCVFLTEWFCLISLQR